MRLLAGLGAGSFVYLIVGQMVGVRLMARRRRVDIARPTSRVGEARAWLAQTGTQVTMLQATLLSFGCAVVGLIATVGLTGVPPLGLLGAGLAGSAPFLVLSQRRRRQTAARLAAWPDALRDLLTHLRASLSVHAGLCRPSFARYQMLAAALDQRAALEVVQAELADPVSDRIVEVILVAFDQGSSVVIDILDDLASATTDDLRLVEEIETAQLETKLEARGAALLPFAVLAMLCSTSGDYRLFYQSPAGWFVVLLGGSLSIVGLLVIRRLGRAPTEARTLGPA
jgi:tight adherence protein B